MSSDPKVTLNECFMKGRHIWRVNPLRITGFFFFNQLPRSVSTTEFSFSKLDTWVAQHSIWAKTKNYFFPCSNTTGIQWTQRPKFSHSRLTRNQLQITKWWHFAKSHSLFDNSQSHKKKKKTIVIETNFHFNCSYTVKIFFFFLLQIK